MIYLNKKQFLPAVILLSVLFVPTILILTCLSVYHHLYQPLTIAGILFFIYLLLIFVFLKISQSKKKYLVMNDEGLDICCANKYCDENTGVWRISYREIEKIDYYKMSSLTGWFSLWTGLLPKCVFVTFRDSSRKEVTVFIGHLDLNQVELLAQKGKIKLCIH